MLTYEVRRRINRPPEAVFDVIGTHVYENHPRWESEVVEVRRLTDGPVGVGSRAIMVRQEYGRRRAAPYEVTEFVPDRKIAFRHLDGPMTFEIAFMLEPADASATGGRVPLAPARRRLAVRSGDGGRESPTYISGKSVAR